MAENSVGAVTNIEAYTGLVRVNALSSWLEVEITRRYEFINNVLKMVET